MKVVILAAGKGSRMGDLTKSTPKPLLKVGDKPILEHLLDALPGVVTEVIIVVDYKKEMIAEFIDRYNTERKIILVLQDQAGTYGALASARDLLANEDFIAVNSDDLLSEGDFLSLIEHPKSIGVFRQLLPNEKTFLLDVSVEGRVIEMRRPTPEEATVPQFMATGSYHFTNDLWDLEPKLINTESTEYGIPQTIKEVLQDYSAAILEDWVQINTPEELQHANELLA